MGWERLFRKKILLRGLDYYYQNAVKNISITDNHIYAIVEGNENYEVNIDLKDNDIVHMDCNCPYADDGNNCKHMAAVLYEWESTNVEEVVLDEVLIDTSSNEIEDLVINASEQDVREFLITILKEDEKLLQRFTKTIHKELSEEDMDYYLDRMNDIVDSHLGYNHFIDYYSAPCFIDDLENFLEYEVRPIISDQNYSIVFTILSRLLRILVTVDMDDSDGGTSHIADIVFSLWIDMIDNASIATKKTLFEAFIYMTNHNDFDYLDDYVDNIIIQKFNDKELFKHKSEYLLNKINLYSNVNDYGYSEYLLNKWLMAYIELLQANDYPSEQIDEICHQYWHSAKIREYMINQAINNQDYIKAIHIIDESLQMDQYNDSLIRKYHLQKKDLYRLLNQQHAYLEELWLIVLEYQVGDLELYKELKSNYTKEEWVSKREEVFNQMKIKMNIDQFYLEEKLYDRLLDIALKEDSLYYIEKYEKVLKAKYPNEILNKYKIEVNNMATYTSNRQHYAYLVSLLKKMSRMKGGKEIVEDIAHDWRIKYKKRRAMMDELNKL